VLGARVIACASPSKLDVTRTMGGADYVIDYTKAGWQKEVLKITGGRGVDVAYDPVGRIKGAIPSTIAYALKTIPSTDHLQHIPPRYQMP